MSPHPVRVLEAERAKEKGEKEDRDAEGRERAARTEPVSRRQPVKPGGLRAPHAARRGRGDASPSRRNRSRPRPARPCCLRGPFAATGRCSRSRAAQEELLTPFCYRRAREFRHSPLLASLRAETRRGQAGSPFSRTAQRRGRTLRPRRRRSRNRLAPARGAAEVGGARRPTRSAVAKRASPPGGLGAGAVFADWVLSSLQETMRSGWMRISGFGCLRTSVSPRTSTAAACGRKRCQCGRSPRSRPPAAGRSPEGSTFNRREGIRFRTALTDLSVDAHRSH